MAAAALDDGDPVRPRRRSAYRGHQLGHFARRQRAERDRLRHGSQLRDPNRNGGIELMWPVRADEQHRRPAQPDQETDEVHGRRISPVEVVSTTTTGVRLADRASNRSTASNTRTRPASPSGAAGPSSGSIAANSAGASRGAPPRPTRARSARVHGNHAGPVRPRPTPTARS